MILSHEQAKALYTSMTAANDVNASYRFTVQGDTGQPVVVEENPESWAVLVRIDAGATLAEHYDNQAEFAQAYGVSIG